MRRLSVDLLTYCTVLIGRSLKWIETSILNSETFFSAVVSSHPSTVSFKIILRFFFQVGISNLNLAVEGVPI